MQFCIRATIRSRRVLLRLDTPSDDTRVRGARLDAPARSL